MNLVIYLSLFVWFISLLVSFYAIARVDRTAKRMKDLDWEAVATLLGDVATVKRSITRLNGRLNGMDNEKPKFNWEEQAAQALAKEEKPVFRGG